MNLLTTYIMNNLRIIKGINPGDTYYDEYLKHYKREGENFFDQYHLAVENAISRKPKRILEIGTRTGISIIQLLSVHPEREKIERIVLCDIWNDGFSSPEIVKLYFKKFNLSLDKVEFLIGDSKETVPKLEGEFDYILVDGSHDKKDALTDLNNSAKIISKNGLIVFDDISKHGCDLLDVWISFKEAHPKEFTFFDNMSGKGTGWAVKI